MIILNSYNIYLIYSLLIITHLGGLYFSVWGTIKFLNWFKSTKDKLLLIYVISFISFCVLIVSSLLYTLTELQHFPPLPAGEHEIRTEVFQDIPSIIMNDVPLHRVITYNLTVE
jgi:Trk-type K+ transport system membrane component